MSNGVNNQAGVDEYSPIEYKKSFEYWHNAYLNPGHEGEGSRWQREALENMAANAKSYAEWREVYNCASGECWNPHYLIDLYIDKSIARDALQHMEELLATEFSQDELVDMERKERIDAVRLLIQRVFQS